MTIEIGSISRLTIPRSQGKQPYYDARKSSWGDIFPHPPKNRAIVRYPAASTSAYASSSNIGSSPITGIGDTTSSTQSGATSTSTSTSSEVDEEEETTFTDLRDRNALPSSSIRGNQRPDTRRFKEVKRKEEKSSSRMRRERGRGNDPDA